MSTKTAKPPTPKQLEVLQALGPDVFLHGTRWAGSGSSPEWPRASSSVVLALVRKGLIASMGHRISGIRSCAGGEIISTQPAYTLTKAGREAVASAEAAARQAPAAGEGE